MNWWLFIPLGLVLIFLWVYWRKEKKLPKSISQGALYGKYGKYIVGGVLGITAVCTWLGGKQDWMHWLFCTGCIVCAVLPLTNEWGKKAHTQAAMIAGMAAAICGFSATLWYGLVWLMFVYYCLLTNCDWKILVAEGCCAIGVIMN